MHISVFCGRSVIHNLYVTS